MTEVPLRRQVGEMLARILSAPSWSLRVTPHNPANMETVAGGSGTTSWYQRTADGPLPAVYVVDGAVLIRELLAITALEWSGSLTRLEKVMDGRPWVRVPLDVVAERDPGCLPAIWALREFSHRVPKDTWELGSNPPSLTIPDDSWDRLELSFAPVECPFRLPEPGEVMDAEEVWARAATTAPRRRPARPKGYQVSIEESEDDDGYPWMLRDDDLADALDVPDAVEAEDLIRAELEEKHPGLATKITFDSEGETFFAYAASAPSATHLAQLIADLVQARRPPQP